MGYVLRFTTVICMGYCFAPQAAKLRQSSARANIKRCLRCLISFSSFFRGASDVPTIHPVCAPVNSGIIWFFGNPACGIDEAVFVVVGKAVFADGVIVAQKVTVHAVVVPDIEGGVFVFIKLRVFHIRVGVEVGIAVKDAIKMLIVPVAAEAFGGEVKLLPSSPGQR